LLAWVSLVGGAEIDVLAIGAEVAACASTLSGANEPLVGAVCVHRENLLIGIVGLLGLVDELGAVCAPISLCVLSAERQLSNVSEVVLSRKRLDKDGIGIGLADGQKHG
jgi:hypothetical protein